MKDEIKNFAKDVGVDDIGFALIENYNSPNTPPIKEIYSKAKIIIVLAFQQLDNCETENIQIASAGSKILSDFADSSTYKIARFLKQKFNATVISIPRMTPVNRDIKTGLLFADVSLRHAAVAAGLGCFGRHNLVIHPVMGTKVVFTAIITDLNIEPDSPIEDDLCSDCDICVNECPVNALDEKNRTDVMKCMFNCRPYGFVGYVQFLIKFSESTLEQQKIMLQDSKFKKLYDELTLGSQYVCFNCIKNCPAGQ